MLGLHRVKTTKEQEISWLANIKRQKLPNSSQPNYFIQVPNAVLDRINLTATMSRCMSENK